MKLSRFTLRDLFWLVLVVGMGCGWWLDRESFGVGYARLLTDCDARVAVSVKDEKWPSLIARRPNDERR